MSEKENTGSHEQVPPEDKIQNRIPTKRILNVVIVLLIASLGYISYTFFLRTSSAQEDLKAQKTQSTTRIIQLDVLNGCGAKGVAAKITNYLRSNGFDVVEMKNYKTSHIHQTMVVDRVGNLDVARRVASAMGVSEKNIIQQINPDYFVDVSVIVGEDYASTQAFH